MADDIALVIRSLGLSKVDLLGFSIGGMEVQDVALRHPDLVRKLLLLGIGPRGGEMMLHAQRSYSGPFGSMFRLQLFAPYSPVAINKFAEWNK